MLAHPKQQVVVLAVKNKAAAHTAESRQALSILDSNEFIGLAAVDLELAFVTLPRYHDKGRVIVAVHQRLH